jgi:hypothetical protein
MPHYRAYAISADNRIERPPVEFECEDDLHAIPKALDYRARGHGVGIELWSGARRVCLLAESDCAPENIPVI